MEKFKFKTNINCNGCIAKVTPFLAEEKNILAWQVDISNPQKILSVETEGLKEEDIVKILNNAGYRAEKLTE
jgi:copper chaperone